MESLFSGFEKEGIAYVHFKSNKNLDKSFEGRADFDVLIDRRRLEKAEAVIISHNGKRHNNIRFGNYPGVDNWLIFDEDTGVIYHLHLHCQIATGKRLIKDYVIPWSDMLLKGRQKDDKLGIFVTESEAELLLLTVRSVVKKRPFKKQFSFGMEEERRELVGRSEEAALAALAAEVLFEGDEKRGTYLAHAVMRDKTEAFELRRVCGMVKKSLEPFRRMGGIPAAFSSFSDYYLKILRKRVNRHMGGFFPTAKTPQAGGAVIAFVGIDGAGKSTVVADVEKWLKSGGIDCRRYYMGIGDGKTSIYTRAVKKAGSLTGGSKKKSSGRRIYFSKQPLAYIKRLFKLSIVYDVERNNYKKLIEMNRYRLNGGISICDRFPQIDTPDRNDGPKAGFHAAILGDNFLTRSFAAKEERLLSIVKTVKPDIVFRLTVPPEVGLKRKNDEINEASVRAHEEKLKGLLGISYQGARIVDIDTSMPYEEEILTIKKKLWELV